MNNKSLAWIQDKFGDIANDCEDISKWIDDAESALSNLRDDLDCLQRNAENYSDDAEGVAEDDSNADQWRELIDLLPDEPSVGEVQQLVELVKKWRADNGYGEV